MWIYAACQAVKVLCLGIWRLGFAGLFYRGLAFIDGSMASSGRDVNFERHGEKPSEGPNSDAHSTLNGVLESVLVHHVHGIDNFPEKTLKSQLVLVSIYLKTPQNSTPTSYFFNRL